MTNKEDLQKAIFRREEKIQEVSTRRANRQSQMENLRKNNRRKNRQAEKLIDRWETQNARDLEMMNSSEGSDVE